MTIDITGRRKRERLLPELVDPLQSLQLITVEDACLFASRTRHHFKTHIEQQPQGTHSTAHQTRQIVAGDIFHHLATEAQLFALAVENTRAQHKIPRRANEWPCRSGQTRCDYPADRRRPAESRRLECQHLPLLCQHRFDLLQRSSRSCGDNQLFGLIIDDSTVP